MNMISQIKKMQQELDTSPTVIAISIKCAKKLVLITTPEDYCSDAILFMVNEFFSENEIYEVVGDLKDNLLNKYKDGSIKLYTVEELAKEYR